MEELLNLSTRLNAAFFTPSVAVSVQEAARSKYGIRLNRSYGRVDLVSASARRVLYRI